MTRRFRDRVTIALETHVANLQASVPGLASGTAGLPGPARRASKSSLVLDHMYMSVLNTIGWIVRGRSPLFC
jgi:ATP-binding cassette subfamily B protein